MYITHEVIDSSKIKVPGFWGEVLTPSKKKFRNLRRNNALPRKKKKIIMIMIIK